MYGIKLNAKQVDELLNAMAIARGVISALNTQHLDAAYQAKEDLLRQSNRIIYDSALRVKDSFRGTEAE